MTIGLYPDTFYRVAARAIIRNTKGEVLVCKENSEHWSLPGGGIEHGEETVESLVRELNEELGIEAGSIQEITFRKSLNYYKEEKQAWLMWLVYEISVQEGTIITPGDGVTETAFIDIGTFKDSTIRSEIQSYRACN